MPFMSAIDPKLYKKKMINLSKLTVHYSKYEHVCDRQVYSIQICWILLSDQIFELK